eukprot:TRINITY_DN64541_c0_g1_i1.p1 TRINITY_DN64541_c0_g1~~TRINITY_DN64541_c0_g1_i1.p1  ORF type:complete len:125 (+),score=32.54 TRINITY_DN64541_c0_g1_i1:81-455(+)
MGVPSTQQIKAAKANQKAAKNKSGRHRKILTKKRTKLESNRQRNARKKKSRHEDRGRVGAPSSAVEEMEVEKRVRAPSKAPVKPGQGSGTVGARFAAANVPKAIRLSKKGGRRRKPTWASFGKG